MAWLLLDAQLTLMIIPVLWLLRAGFFMVDVMAAGLYEDCYLNCNGFFPPPKAQPVPRPAPAPEDLL